MIDGQCSIEYSNMSYFVSVLCSKAAFKSSFYRLQVIHQLSQTNLKGSELKDLIGKKNNKPVYFL